MEWLRPLDFDSHGCGLTSQAGLGSEGLHKGSNGEDAVFEKGVAESDVDVIHTVWE